MRRRLLRSSAGFTYLAALVMVIVTGLLATRAVVVWRTALQREREQELLFRGMQYMDALRRWYWPKGIQAGSPPLPGGSGGGTGGGAGNQQNYPATLPPGVAGPTELKDLLTGTGVAPTPCLRRLYPDPMTGKEFVPLKDPLTFRIYGVASSSDATPIKQGDFFLFDVDPSDFEGKTKYSDWQFICIHWPKQAATGRQNMPGAKDVKDLGSPPPPPPPPPPPNP